MSRKRTLKDRRRARRKVTRAGKAAARRRCYGMQPEADVGGRGLISLVEWEVTWEPIEDADDNALSPQLRQRLDDLREAWPDGFGERVEELEAMVEQCPEHRALHNWLACAYGQVGRHEEAKAMIRRIYQRFPSYVFGMANYAKLCIREGDLDEAARVIDGRWTLLAFEPNRRRFHVTEVVSYHAMIADYHLAVGDYEAASRMASLLADIAPNDPETRRLETKLRVRKMLRGVKERLFGRRRTKGDAADTYTMKRTS